MQEKDFVSFTADEVRDSFKFIRFQERERGVNSLKKKIDRVPEH